MARRVGSARAAKVRSRCPETFIPIQLYNDNVIYSGTTSTVKIGVTDTVQVTRADRRGTRTPGLIVDLEWAKPAEAGSSPIFAAVGPHPNSAPDGSGALPSR